LDGLGNTLFSAAIVVNIGCLTRAIRARQHRSLDLPVGSIMDHLLRTVLFLDDLALDSSRGRELLSMASVLPFLRLLTTLSPGRRFDFTTIGKCFGNEFHGGSRRICRGRAGVCWML